MNKKLLFSIAVGIGAAFLIPSCSPNEPQSSDKEITAFSIVNPAVPGIIDDAAKTITVVMPRGTDLSALVALFTTTGTKVSVGSVEQTSGVTANDFTRPVVYTVTAEDNSTVSYTVTVTVVKSSEKAITAFSFADPAAVGSIDTAAKAVSVLVPRGTDLTALIATFTTTGAKVSVGSTEQTSGVTANNFTSPVAYTVTAEDNSTATYTVTVTPKKLCMFVSAIADTGDPRDVPMMNKLKSWGYEVSVVVSTDLTLLTDSFVNYDFAFLSESPNSSHFSPMKGHPLPIISLESWASAKANVLNWSTYPGAVSNYDTLALVIAANASSELTGGLAAGAEFKFVTSTSVLNEAEIGFIPTIQHLPIAVFKCDTLVSDMVAFKGIDSTAIAFTGGLLTAACAVEKGVQLADGVSTTLNRAVAIGIHASAYEYVTGEAYAMIRAGIEWILK